MSLPSCRKGLYILHVFLSKGYVSVPASPARSNLFPVTWITVPVRLLRRNDDPRASRSSTTTTLHITPGMVSGGECPVAHAVEDVGRTCWTIRHSTSRGCLSHRSRWQDFLAFFPLASLKYFTAIVFRGYASSCTLGVPPLHAELLHLPTLLWATELSRRLVSVGCCVSLWRERTTKTEHRKSRRCATRKRVSRMGNNNSPGGIST